MSTTGTAEPSKTTTMDDKAIVEPLDLDNYGTWNLRMKFLLIHKGLWAATTAEETPEATMDQKALAAICLMLM